MEGKLTNNELLQKIAEGDESALETLVNLNMGLVKNIAKRFIDRGCEYEDLVQIGTIGMIKAARSFDFSYNTVFSTYAVPLIIGEIRRFLRDDGPIKISRKLKVQGINIMKQKEAFIREYGREPKISELAEKCEVSVEDLVSTLEATSPIHSLTENVGGDADGMQLQDFLSTDDSELEILTDKIALREAISNLDDNQKKIIHLRYFRELSQQTTGEILGLTQVKVSREEKKIIKILKSCL